MGGPNRIGSMECSRSKRSLIIDLEEISSIFFLIDLKNELLGCRRGQPEDTPTPDNVEADEERTGGALREDAANCTRKRKARPRREQCGEGGGRSAADADGSRLLRGITRGSGHEVCDLAAARSFRVRRGGAGDGGKRGSGEYGPQRG